LYWLGATAIFVALFQRSEPFWTAAYKGVAGGAAAIALLMVCLFLTEVAKAPATLRRKRLEPPSIEFRLQIRNDSIHQNVMEVEKEIGEYEQFRKLIGHGAVNDELADKALAKLNARVEQFGLYAARTTFEDGVWRRRRLARRVYRRIQGITHDTDLGEVRKGLDELKKTW
jgi:hypothetical protein